jgi:hypothetical protein
MAVPDAEDRARDSGFKLIQKLLDREVGCVEGMARFLAWTDEKPGGSWKKLAGIDWSADLAPVSAWLTDFTARYRPPTRVRALWFSCPEIDINEAVLDWCACASFDPKDKNIEWASEPIWPDSDKHRSSTYGLRALGEARERLGLAAASVSDRTLQRESLMTYLLPLVSVSLLMREVLAALPTDRFVAPKGVGVAVGFASGDFVRLPLLRTRGARARR